MERADSRSEQRSTYDSTIALKGRHFARTGLRLWWRVLRRPDLDPRELKTVSPLHKSPALRRLALTGVALQAIRLALADLANIPHRYGPSSLNRPVEGFLHGDMVMPLVGEAPCQCFRSAESNDIARPDFRDLPWPVPADAEITEIRPGDVVWNSPNESTGTGSPTNA